jgi:hypothetical protein
MSSSTDGRAGVLKAIVVVLLLATARPALAINTITFIEVDSTHLLYDITGAITSSGSVPSSFPGLMDHWTFTAPGNITLNNKFTYGWQEPEFGSSANIISLGSTASDLNIVSDQPTFNAPPGSLFITNNGADIGTIMNIGSDTYHVTFIDNAAASEPIRPAVPDVSPTGGLLLLAGFGLAGINFGRSRFNETRRSKH